MIQDIFIIIPLKLLDEPRVCHIERSQSERRNPSGSGVKNPSTGTGDTGSILGSEGSPGERNGNPLGYSCLRNPSDRGAQQATVHGFTKSWT